MNRRAAIRNLMVAAVVSLSRRLKGIAPDDPPDFVIRSDVRLVLLDVSVKDRDGGWFLVYGLACRRRTRPAAVPPSGCL